MADVVFLTITIAFFALCALYVRACDGIVRSGHSGRIVGVDESRPEDER